MKLIKDFTTKNPCYKYNVNKIDSRYTNFQKNGPKGLMLHSIGVGQNKASVIANNFNSSGAGAAVHAVLQEDGTVIQCMPWNYRLWHCGGAANNTHIGVEMTEPDCIKYTGGSTFKCSNVSRAKQQVKGTYKTAVELFAYLCKRYNLDPMKKGVILSHAEGYKKGVASNHGDPEHLWKQLGMGYTMDGFRKDVKAAMGGVIVETKTESAPVNTVSNKVKVTADVLNVRKGPGTNYDIATTIKKDEVYTIIEESGKWGLLKSKAGWISLDYVKKV